MHACVVYTSVVPVCAAEWRGHKCVGVRILPDLSSLWGILLYCRVPGFPTEHRRCYVAFAANGGYVDTSERGKI